MSTVTIRYTYEVKRNCKIKKKQFYNKPVTVEVPICRLYIIRRTQFKIKLSIACKNNTITFFAFIASRM